MRPAVSRHILQRLATYIEKSVKLNSQVKSAMIYPVAVISIACIVVMVILWKVIPVFASLFASLGAELPLPTRVVIAMSNFIGDFWWLVTILLIAGWYALRKYHGTYKGKRVIDGLLLRMPVVGMLLQYRRGRFCARSPVPLRAFPSSTACRSRPAPPALIIEDAIMATASGQEGKTSRAPGRTTSFRRWCADIAVGEQTVPGHML